VLPVPLVPALVAPPSPPDPTVLDPAVGAPDAPPAVDPVSPNVLLSSEPHAAMNAQRTTMDEHRTTLRM
jgi:hypothetical protein